MQNVPIRTALGREIRGCFDAEPGNVIWATGHFRNGVLLTPITADAVADLLTGVEPTADGRALVDAVRRQRDAYLAQRLSTLSREDVATLERAAVLLEELTADLP